MQNKEKILLIEQNRTEFIVLLEKNENKHNRNQFKLRSIK